jgi:hypothetical protein
MHIIDCSGHHAFGIAEPRTFVAVFGGRARSGDIIAMRDALVAYADADPAPVHVFVVVQERATIGENGRKQITRMMQDAVGRTAAWTVVIEGSGFWASAARSIAAGIRLASRSAYPLKVASTLDEGIRWMTSKTDARLRLDFAERVEDLRARLPPADAA